MPEKKKKAEDYESWEEIPLDEFKNRIAAGIALADKLTIELDKLFPGLVTLTKEQRKGTPRLREGEHGHLITVLDVVDLKPALFESLADRDEGMDPKKFETGLLRERIEKHRLFGEINKRIAPIADELSDTPLYLASRFRDALSAAYRIAKMHSDTDQKIKNILAPVIDFMSKGALAAAVARKKKVE